jgi:hypothetical protein
MRMLTEAPRIALGLLMCASTTAAQDVAGD